MQTAAAADVPLINRTKRLLHLPPLFDVPKDAEGNDRPELMLVPPLAPPHPEKNPGGKTLVNAALWERARTTKPVKQWLALGWVEVERAPAIAEDAEPPATLSDFQPPAAIGLVETETSEGTLRMWLAAESRQPVKAAIDKRLKSLPAAAPRK